MFLKTSSRARLLALTCLLDLAAPRRLPAQTYTITELPPLAGDTYCSAYALNESGQAAGNSGSRAVIWTNGVPRNIQTLSGVTFSVVFGLNDSGQAAGDAFPTGINSNSFFWNGGSMQAIAPAPRNYLSEAYAINNSGVVVGTGGDTFGYRWQSGGVPQSLGLLPGDHSARPLAINNFGLAAGSSQGNTGYHPVIWGPFTAQAVPLPGGVTGGRAWGISDSGAVVGEYYPEGATRPFLWSSALGAQDLPLPAGVTNGYAWAINDAGAIIGDAGGQAAIWRKNASGAYAVTLLATLLPGGSGWNGLNLYAINEAGQIAGDGNLNGQSRGFILNPELNMVPAIRATFVSRDDPYSAWSDSTALVLPNPVYAGDGTGDLISWQVGSAPAGAIYKWTAVQVAGLTHQSINGPEGPGQDHWSLIDGSFNWAPGRYRVECKVTPIGQSAIVLSEEFVVGWRTQDYAVIGQVKPINDYEISDARRIILKNALIVSYFTPKEGFLSAASKLSLFALSTELNAKIWTAFQFLRYGSKTTAPEYVSLHGARADDKYWMLQTLLNDYPDLVPLPNMLEPGDLDTLLAQKSYRMYSRNQLRYLLSSNGRLDVSSLHSIHHESDIGPTKFARASQELVSAIVTVRGVQIDLQGNSEQSFLTAESAPESGTLAKNLSQTAVWLYTAGRIGLEGRVPNYALLGRDAPYIFTKIVTAIGPDGRDTSTRIHLSVDTVWRPNETITGTTHFNEIRIYKRSYSDPTRRFVLSATGPFEIQGQLAAFLQSGSERWPGLPPENNEGYQ